MAPIEKTDHDLVEQQIKDTIQSLFQLLVQVSTYDQAGRATQPVLAAELATLSQSLRAVHRTAASSLAPRPAAGAAGNNNNNNHHQTPPPPTTTTLPDIPDPLIEYVEAGRNPDIYTREFVELVRRMNQLARGKEAAFVRFRDVLARETAAAMPELAADVHRVVEATGGREPIPPVVKGEEGDGEEEAAVEGVAAGAASAAGGETGNGGGGGGGGEGAGEADNKKGT